MKQIDKEYKVPEKVVDQHGSQEHLAADADDEPTEAEIWYVYLNMIKISCIFILFYFYHINFIVTTLVNRLYILAITNVSIR